MVRYVLSIGIALGFLLTASAPALANPPEWYPPLEWVPAAAGNYDAGRTAQVRAIVIHETEGPWSSVIHWFRHPRSRASAHYLVRAWDGGIMQFVAESDTAYHARSANPWTIGVEHEFDLRLGIRHTDIQYRTSAALVCAIARRYGIPLDRNHIVGHNELPGNDHRDPGPTWNWNYYMSLVHAACLDQGRVSARSVEPECDGCLAYGNEGDEVALLQTHLVLLGFLSEEDLAGGEGTFGPRTQAALTAYQEANGLETTGVYAEPDAAVLAKSLEADAAARREAALVLVALAGLTP